jgi:hypothetical protein
MTLTYSTYISEIAAITVISSNILVNGDAQFGPIAPGMIDYAEQRLYREGDFLSTYITDTSTNVVANNRIFNYPTGTGTFLVIDQINIYTPAGTTSSNAIRVPLQVSSKQFIDIVYPSNVTSIGVPTYFAPATATYCTLGPIPDQSYGVEIIGTQRPTPLSSANSSTFLTNTLPDLFIAASMIFISGYMRNFGAQADDPQMAQSWSGQYDKLFASANVEELRKKYSSQGWQAQNVNQIATPPRV